MYTSRFSHLKNRVIDKEFLDRIMVAQKVSQNLTSEICEIFKRNPCIEREVVNECNRQSTGLEETFLES